MRDLLCGVVPKDFDIVTQAKPEQVKRLFRRSRIIGRRFKLVHVYAHQEVFEVITFRGVATLWQRIWWRLFSKKMQTNNVYGTIDQDVMRRDFTINSLYYDIRSETIIDYVGGYEDLCKRRICFIGDDKVRVEEDSMRILRALRYSAKTGFEIKAPLQSCLKSHVDLILNQSKDRLFVDFSKFFMQAFSKRGMHLLLRYGVLNKLLSGYDNCYKDPEVKAFLDHLMQSNDNSIRQNKPMSRSLFYAGLLLPLIQKIGQNDHHHGSSLAVYNRDIKRVWQVISTRIKFPRRLQEEIMVIWRIQFMITQGNLDIQQELSLHPRYKSALKMLNMRALVNAKLADDLLAWDL